MQGAGQVGCGLHSPHNKAPNKIARRSTLLQDGQTHAQGYGNVSTSEVHACDVLDHAGQQLHGCDMVGQAASKLTSTNLVSSLSSLSEAPCRNRPALAAITRLVFNAVTIRQTHMGQRHLPASYQEQQRWTCIKLLTEL